MNCSWTVGDSLPNSQREDLAYFLTERYALYSIDRRGMPCIGHIHHEPWALRNARLKSLEDCLVNAAGITVPECEPILHHADHLHVLAWPLKRIQ